MKLKEIIKWNDEKLKRHVFVKVIFVLYYSVFQWPPCISMATLCKIVYFWRLEWFFVKTHEQEFIAYSNSYVLNFTPSGYYTCHQLRDCIVPRLMKIRNTLWQAGTFLIVSHQLRVIPTIFSTVPWYLTKYRYCHRTVKNDNSLSPREPIEWYFTQKERLNAETFLLSSNVVFAKPRATSNLTRIRKSMYIYIATDPVSSCCL